MKIIQVNQFASGEHIEKLVFDDITEEKVSVDAHDICDHIGTSFQIKEVHYQVDKPTVGYVWYKKGKDGKCEHYLHCYDTSD